jgi:hypothetical protein
MVYERSLYTRDIKYTNVNSKIVPKNTTTGLFMRSILEAARPCGAAWAQDSVARESIEQKRRAIVQIRPVQKMRFSSARKVGVKSHAAIFVDEIYRIIIHSHCFVFPWTQKDVVFRKNFHRSDAQPQRVLYYNFTSG